MTEVLASPRYTLIRNVAAPVGADGSDTASTPVDCDGFAQIALYWDGALAADTDTLTGRVVFNDRQNGIPIRSIPFVLPARTIRIFRNYGESCNVRIDVFSNAAVPCQIRMAGFGKVSRRAA